MSMPDSALGKGIGRKIETNGSVCISDDIAV